MNVRPKWTGPLQAGRRPRCKQATTAIFSSRPCLPPAVTAPSPLALSSCRRSSSRLPFLSRACSCRPARLRRQLSIRAGDQRPDHHDPAALAIFAAAVARVAAACERIPVHRDCSGRSRPHLSESADARWPFQRRFADHRLALHGLARRFSAVRAWIRAAQGQGWRPRNQGAGLGVDFLERGRGLRPDGGRDVRADGTARPAARASRRQRLRPGTVRCGVDRVAYQPFGPDRPVAAASAFGPRRLAHGGVVRLAARRGVVGAAQLRTVRFRLLYRPRLRACRRLLRAGGVAAAKHQFAGAAVPFAPCLAPRERVRTTAPFRARAAVQLGR